MNLKKTQIVILALAALAAGKMGYDHFFDGSNSHDGQTYVVENGEGHFVDDSTKDKLPVSPDIRGGSVVANVLPERVLAAPSYDKLIMAARIINEAINVPAAQKFVGLQEQRRNAMLQAEVSRYMAEAKKYEADYEAAQAKIKKSKDGIIVSDVSDMDKVRSNNTMEMMVEGTKDDSIVKREEKDSIGLRHLDETSKEMMIKIGDRWFSSVKSGQTIDGYLVGALDTNLKCVPLTKEKKTEVICLN